MRTGLEEPRRKLVTMWTKLVAKCFHYLYVAMVKITKANNVRWAERFLDPQLQWVHCCLAPCAGTMRRGWRNVVITNRKGPEIIYPARAARPHVTSFSQTLTPTISTTSFKEPHLLATGCMTPKTVGDLTRFNPSLRRWKGVFEEEIPSHG